jgi:hypothetical protein
LNIDRTLVFHVIESPATTSRRFFYGNRKDGNISAMMNSAGEFRERGHVLKLEDVRIFASLSIKTLNPL